VRRCSWPKKIAAGLSQRQQSVLLFFESSYEEPRMSAQFDFHLMMSRVVCEEIQVPHVIVRNDHRPTDHQALKTVKAIQE